MKVFLCDFSTKELLGVAEELRNKGVEILYWTGAKKLFEEISRDTIRYPMTIFHNTFDAVRAISPPTVDSTAFEPPSARLITDMLQCESIVLSMMNRMDFGNMPLAKKKHLYYKYVSYWNGVLKKLQPDALIFSEIPHAVYNFVLYSLAKKRGIKTVILATSTVWGWLNLVCDYKKNDECLLAEYKRIEHEKHDIDELHPSLRLYFSKLRSDGDVTPMFNKEQDKRMKNTSLIVPDLAKIVKYSRTNDFWKRAYWHLRSLFFLEKKPLNIDESDSARRGSLWELRKINHIKQELKKEYRAVQAEVDLGKKFVYLPLHFQPERSTSPMGGYFADQILMAKTIAAVLPEGWRLYIKEYPLQWNPYSYRSHLARYKGYYKELSEIPKTFLVAVESSAYSLINASQAVATATGTSGMEALVMGKPVLVFGYPWYMYCDGALRVDGISGCREAFAAIENGQKPNPDKVLNYFIAFQRTAIRTNQKSRYQRFQSVSNEESIQNMTNAFWRAL